MKIVALDAYGINPGDLSWEPFTALGEFTAHERSSPAELIPRSRDADALLIDYRRVDAAHFEELPRLKYLGLLATGHDQINLRAARSAGVAVTNIPDYSTMSVAQMALAHILHFVGRVGDYDSMVRRGEWLEGRQFRYLDAPITELAGKTMGILSLGSIGTALARIAIPLGMRVISCRRGSGNPPGLPVEWVAYDEIFRQSDILSLHLPLTDETRGMINRRVLALMKPDALLVNVSRGALIVDADLADALNAGRLGAAALDGLGPSEPPSPANPLLGARNCVITPHVAWSTREARQRCLAEAAANLRAFLDGRRRNRVD